MSAWGLGCAKTQSDLVVMPCRRRIFVFACTARDHRPQNYWCVYTACCFHTARVIFVGGDRGRGPVYVRSSSAYPPKLAVKADILVQRLSAITGLMRRSKSRFQGP